MVDARLLYPQTEMGIRQQALEDADRLLNTAWDGTIPVDPVVIARTLGIDVVEAQIAPQVSGALVKRLGEDPQILLNAADSPNRKRFTAGHELGHYVLRSDNPDEYESIDFRGHLAATGGSEEEVYANEFAASLLMPAWEVRRVAKQGLSDVELAAYFGVSREAMQYRLSNLNISYD